MCSGSRSGGTSRTSTGSGARSASAPTAALRPRSASTAGWIPRASSRSSLSARSSSSRERSSSMRGVPAVRAEPVARHPEGERERHEPLLRAVVEVALEPAALAPADLDEPRARRAHLLHLGAQLRLEALVLERQRGGRAGLAHALGVVQQGRVVDDRGDPPPVAVDLGDGLPVSARAAPPDGPRRPRTAWSRAASRRARPTGRRAPPPGRRAARLARGWPRAAGRAGRARGRAASGRAPGRPGTGTARAPRAGSDE